MEFRSRKLLDRAFTAVGFIAIAVLAAALFVILLPIIGKGVGAFWFEGTVEFRRFTLEQFNRGNPAEVEAEIRECREARQPVFARIAAFEKEVESMDGSARRKYRSEIKEVKASLRDLFGPLPGDPPELLTRNQYGQTRWDRAQVNLGKFLYIEEYDYSDTTAMGKKKLVPRASRFAGTSMEGVFAEVERALGRMLNPRRTFYWRFLTDASVDAHMFGGVWAEVVGTFYLALGAMLFAIPFGVMAAVYLAEYARDTTMVSALRMCISTLAGVPSIVFGLFGLAFFINTMHVSPSKSVLAGSLTLALLVLPTVIRASEEAIRAVPKTYREAALSLGATRGRSVLTVILPAALPGVLTGIVISMGRAAGETAPIIFTAAVSVGDPITLVQTLTHPTPALPWNIYNIATEHVAVDEIRHVQFGMVFVLVGIVLLLNLAAIVLRARIARKLKG
jgi:phosphate transport system permease protein